jgi:ribosomal protein S18 acetylase RimI-like enzyme
MSEMVIRDARASELDRVRDITRAAYAEFEQAMAPGAWRAFRGAMESGLEMNAGAQCIVAVDGEHILGSVLLYPAGIDAYGDGKRLAAPEFRLLAVTPEARGRGVGRLLIDECVSRSRAAGATELGLHTSRSFRAAIAIYQKMGFERVPERDFQPDGAELVEGFRLSF